MLNFLQKLGKSLMLPIAVMPAAALMLRLGQDDLLGIPFVAAAGDAVFANLAILFAIGIAIGLSKDGSGAAALAGAVGYFVLSNGTEAINKDINMDVLGGIISGITAGLLYNRFSGIKLPEWLGFFGGKRFVPIVTSFAMIILAGIFGVIWPPIQEGINNVGEWITGAGALGAGIFGFLNRLLLPVGLHHVLNSLVWFVFGEFNGANGDLKRFFAGDPTAGAFMTGFFPIMMFGLPAAAAAMIAAAKKEKRKAVAGMLGGLALTSFLTGITEPIEFLFMFLSPLLYVVHALLTGLSMAISVMLGIHHGFGFSAGAIDYFLNLGIAQKPLFLIPIGIVYAVLYFVIFYTLIKKLDIETPGREKETADSEKEGLAVQGDGTTGHKAAAFIENLGGKDNITSLDHCATRLRLTVADSEKVKDQALKANGARGVMKLGKTGVQVIVGTNVQFVYEDMKNIMSGQQPSAPSTENTMTSVNHPGSLTDFSLPIAGRVMPLSEVPDEVFSNKLMGDGFAIEPTGDVVEAPFNGEIVTIFPTKHAIGLRSDEGHEVLIHVGLDTVHLKGEGFEALKKDGDRIRRGEPLLKVDLDYIHEHAPSAVTPVIFTNLEEGQAIELNKTGEMRTGTSDLIKIV
ncbi:N-acetylglucosamine-specific PTS transporter subunit IIBC [Bacillus sp. PK3_68]|uniref:N-acetylglucosamine-specific PTS transporter subunit IIBC n=1 Tax=Bacillus sp. PK3_68 TaxID=2027408 RepID=UPI000E72619D|nr:N-acetylglucosamine-specific PTS transporter subunit IIBC [Bacillus sp. PK3_68]RJS58924.1 PTS N-acetyl glucosamine transporter subunit IIABC [Bacillus sp. PK3_68]